jgi:hypothetical protein
VGGSQRYDVLHNLRALVFEDLAVITGWTAIPRLTRISFSFSRAPYSGRRAWRARERAAHQSARAGRDAW